MFFAFCLAHQGIAQETIQSKVELSGKPEVKIDHPVFTFESVPEGVHVAHEFIIKNNGEALLTIHNVLPP